MRRHLLRIRHILERRIVPSLILDPAQVIPSSSAGAEDEAGLSDAVLAMALQDREEEARSELRAMREAGRSAEDIQLGLLAPAAEKLGALWDGDMLSFVDVTVAVGALQRLMHFVAVDLTAAPVMTKSPRTICIFPEPGSAHTLGASMAARFFERAGWRVEFVPDADRSTLKSIMRTRNVDLLGLSLARGSEAERAGSLIDDLRTASRNPDLLTVAGGSALVRNPMLLSITGADAMLAALRGAPTAASRMVERGRTDLG